MKMAITKKVKELSDEIINAVITSEELVPDSIGGDVACLGIIYHDFRVFVPNKNDPDTCQCFYGGQSLSCKKDQPTSLEESDATNQMDCMYTECIVRKYSEICVKGFQKKERESKQE
jgi:hypothetical protein